VQREGAPIVIKAEGLAAGKGVTVCQTLAQAEAAIEEALVAKAFGDAGARILIEECLIGEEASILALVDGRNVVMLASAQDHKRALDGDQGPNTGGMGAYSPAPVVKPYLWPVIREQVFERTLAELRRRGIVFKGVLYAGLMLTANGIKVLEFNARFGDPETQVILPRLDGDLIPAFEACIDGTLSEALIRWKDEACVTVVMAAEGYPGKYPRGQQINGLAAAAAIRGQRCSMRVRNSRRAPCWRMAGGCSASPRWGQRCATRLTMPMPPSIRFNSRAAGVAAISPSGHYNPG
jgi:phosphoribosylamine---glycine ligase